MKLSNRRKKNNKVEKKVVRRKSLEEITGRKKKAESLKHDTLVEIYKMLQKNNKRYWYSSHRNAACVWCDITQRHMMRVGILILCVKCFNKYFDAESEARDDKQYKELCKVYDEKLTKEMEEEDL